MRQTDASLEERKASVSCVEGSLRQMEEKIITAGIFSVSQLKRNDCYLGLGILKEAGAESIAKVVLIRMLR